MNDGATCETCGQLRPEPSPNSVVLDRDGDAWQRTGSAWRMAGNHGARTWEELVQSYGVKVVLFDPSQENSAA